MSGRELKISTKKFMKRLRLSDWFLLTFMGLLMAQAGWVLLWGNGSVPDTGSLDAVSRTTMAAIFGYFISAGFLHRKSEWSPLSEEGAQLPSTGGSVNSSAAVGGMPAPKAQIGFLAEPEQKTTVQTGRMEMSASQEALLQTERLQRRRIRQQTVIVGTIGILSLLILIFARSMAEISPSSIAAVSQLRDFISGSVGLLIGHSTRE